MKAKVLKKILKKIDDDAEVVVGVWENESRERPRNAEITQVEHTQYAPNKDGESTSIVVIVSAG